MPADGPWTLTVQGPCAPDEVWDRYLRPDRWPGWSPQIRSVDHDGAVVTAGSRGVVHALGGLRVPFEVLDVDVRDPADRSWTWVAGLPAGVRLRLVHVVRPSARHAGGTTTLLRVHGPAPVVAGYLPVAWWALRRLVR